MNWRPALNRLIDKEAYSERLDDLLADDWEIQEPTVTITRAQFWEAVQTVLLESGGDRPYDWTMRMGDLARRLGLEGEP